MKKPGITLFSIAFLGLLFAASSMAGHLSGLRQPALKAQAVLQAASAKPQRPKSQASTRIKPAAAALAGAGAVALAMPSHPRALAKSRDGEAEARLIEVYRLIGQAKGREALAKAETLVRDNPNFQLAQLVYGDLLSSQVRPINAFGAVPSTTARDAAPMLTELREESRIRLKALSERPPQGSIPSQFLAISARTRHAIAVDASRSRLYLFENSTSGLKLVADYYISVGKSGIEKSQEGDQRTPLGVYYITSNLDPKSLKDFYGSGALPINYPNPLDQSRGKTGGGIWLHGTPPSQFSRAPKASDGCVVLANPDLERIIRTVEVRLTPVVIAQQLQWSDPHRIRAESKSFEDTLQAWRNAKVSGDLPRLLAYYAPDFRSFSKTLPEWTPTLRSEISSAQGRSIELKDVSFLRWTDTADTMVATFGEVVAGTRTGPVKRQYWVRRGNSWKIFFEGVIG
jgi:murein L,D-transpeptidase YafK